ncbi:MAG: type VII secretion-associated serine protease mycosin [Mycobacterium sp.]|jgi:membrane-anchored mycosin MYCP
MRPSATGGRAVRCAAVVLTVLLTATVANVPTALAVSPPVVDPALVPPDGRPGPEQPMRQSNLCARTTLTAVPDVTLPTPGFAMLNVRRAWQHSTGNGVTVALIDTGVNPHPRLPVLPGGDYVMGGDGLTDCDAHGTIVASLITAAPSGIPMPPPLPPNPPRTVAVDAPEVSGAPDGVAGVAPHAALISIRQSSRAFEPVNQGFRDGAGHRKAGTVATLARAVVHAANSGADVINVSVAACVAAADPLDQRMIGAAVWYAATVTDAVIVAAAGNASEDGCAQNPVSAPMAVGGSRDWSGVTTVSSPSWFSDYVLSVGAVDETGAPIAKSLAGPWVGVAAPGTSIVGLSPETGGPVNAYPPVRPGEPDVGFWGTSFAAAYVSGVAALVRAKYPELSAHQVINRILQTAHNPPAGVDNEVGYGVVDAVAALTFSVPAGERSAPGAGARVLTLPPPPPPPDHRAHGAALAFAGVIAACVLMAAVIARARRS